MEIRTVFAFFAVFLAFGDSVYIKRGELTSSQLDDYFGYCMVGNDDLLIVGAPDTQVNNTLKVGVAHVFIRNDSNPYFTQWSENGTIGADDLGSESLRFGISLALDENVLAVGAGASKVSAGSGVVYLFSQGADGGWEQKAKITPDPVQSNDFFGRAVSLSISTGFLAVGAPALQDFKGAVYVFQLNGTTVISQSVLMPQDLTPLSLFGTAVQIKGEELIASAPQLENGGAFYTFLFNGTSWVQQERVSAFDTAPFDRFGSSLLRSGETLFVGAQKKNLNSEQYVGAAYVFSRKIAENGSRVWEEKSKLLPSNSPRSSLNEFGSSLATDSQAQSVLVGASTEAAAYLFSAVGESWVQTNRFDVKSSNFAFESLSSVAMSRNNSDGIFAANHRTAGDFVTYFEKYEYVSYIVTTEEQEQTQITTSSSTSQFNDNGLFRSDTGERSQAPLLFRNFLFLTLLILLLL